jgi:hypothetical protein
MVFKTINKWQKLFVMAEEDLQLGVNGSDIALGVAVGDLQCKREDFEMALTDAMASVDNMTDAIICWHGALRAAEVQYNDAVPQIGNIGFPHKKLERLIKMLMEHRTLHKAEVDPNSAEPAFELGEGLEHMAAALEVDVDHNTAASEETAEPETFHPEEATGHNESGAPETSESGTAETMVHDTSIAQEATGNNASGHSEVNNYNLKPKKTT